MEMKMKKKDQKHKYGSKARGSGTLALRFSLCVLCLTFLPLLLLTSLMGIASANSAAESGIEPAPSGLVVVTDPNNLPQRALWRADISIAKDRGDEKSKSELMRMIEQVRSVSFTPENRVVESVVVVPVESSVVEPKEALPDAEVASELERDVRKPRLAYEPISESTLQVLRDLAKEPEKVDNPFELGETLFLSGNEKEAAVFYTEALGRTEPNDISLSRDRAWVLFQTGNCLRNSDLPVAMKMYTQLITEYANSPWADMAIAQVKVLDWYLKDEPYKLVVNVEPAGDK
jgi:hypothetical protein